MVTTPLDGFLKRLFAGNTARETRKPSAEKPLRVLVLSGWGHVPEAVDNIIPPGAEIRHVDYHAKSFEQVMQALKAEPPPDVMIGWSMGGRLAVTAVAKNIVQPKLLVLLSTSSKSVGESLDVKALADTYRISPAKAREHFIEQIMQGDTQQKAIHPILEKQVRGLDEAWLAWLDLDVHARDLDYSSMPRTLIIQGMNDVFIKREHAEFFHHKIPNSEALLLPDCGHAPHLHSPKQVSVLINNEIDELRRQNLLPRTALSARAGA